MATSAGRRRRVPEDDSLTVYLRDISAYPLLDRAEENALARRIRVGDREGLERLVCSNLRFVVSVAKIYQHQGVSLADLVNEGNLGLLRAAERFDESKGVKFVSYAVWWIRQAIVQALADQGHTVRVPAGRATVLRRIGRRASALRQTLGREPTRDEVVAALGAADAVVARMPIARSYLSLDAPIGGSEGERLLDRLPDETAAAPDGEVADNDLADSVEAALCDLRGREATIVRLYFGFDGGDPMTLERIGDMLGITRERVRQIKARALARLRVSGHGPVLESLRNR